MGIVILNVTTSLDGYMTGPDVSTDQPMGEGGLRLHEWIFNTSTSPVDAEVMQDQFASTGAVILGRRTFDVGIGAWEDTPYPVHCFVLTHEPRADMAMKSGTFTFVTDGIQRALMHAKEAAGSKNISLMGGDIAQQYLNSGLVDEIHLQIAPLLLGSGQRLFDRTVQPPIELERIRVIESPFVTHLHFRVVK